MFSSKGHYSLTRCLVFN